MTYVISDIHGHYSRYQAMLKQIRCGNEDMLYVLGDMIDRGPDGVKVLLDLMARPNVTPILGNHELTAAVCLPWLMKEITDESIAALEAAELGALSEWMVNGGSATLRDLRRLSQEDRRAILEYIREMDLYAEADTDENSFVLVHAGLAGFEPGRALEDYGLEDFVLARPDLDGPCFPDRYLVFGHTPTRSLGSGADVIVRKGRQIAIDCGCGFGGRLGCLCLETMEEFYA